MQTLCAAQAIPLIGLEGISKRFGRIWACREISLEIREGEIHALVGENGAGKSTLMKILYGHLQADAGRIYVRGTPVRFQHPREALGTGIGMVHQQLLIFPQLSALENVIVGSEPGVWGWLRPGEARERVLELCSFFGFDLPLSRLAGDLSFAQRQQIELLRILFRKARVLILDEPTSLLAPPEVTNLLDLLKGLQSRGHTILFISHRLQEVFYVADRISVLRRGQCTGTFAASQISPERIAREIVSGATSPGMEIHQARLDAEVTGEMHDLDAAPPLLELDKVASGSAVHEVGLMDFSFQVRAGEVLGIGGVVGNGQRTLARIVAGAEPVEQGRVVFAGEEITRYSTKQRATLGIRWLPANPLEEALLPARPVWENTLLGVQRESRHHLHGWLRTRDIAAWAAEQLKTNEVVYAGLWEPVESLSGGNQQKLALARVMTGSPRFVVLEQPGRGLDIHAQAQLRRKLCAMNQRGVTFLLFSHDLEELLALSHRVGVLYRGQLMGLMEKQKVSRKMLGRWMLGLQD